MVNEEEFRYCNIPAWHKAGYRGQGIKVAVLEDTGQGHGLLVADILGQVAPGAQILGRPRPRIATQGGKLVNGTRERLTTYYQGLAAEEINLCAMSLGGSGAKELEELEQRLLIDQGLVLFTSAGNKGREIDQDSAANLSTWIAVGACTLVKGKPRRTGESQYGPKLAVMGFSSLSAITGGVLTQTSCANPFVAGMCALWFGWYKEKHGRTPNQQETLAFIREHSERLGEGDRDDMHGYGLLRLPEPSSLIVPEPQPPKEVETMFTDTKGHWAEADIEKAAEAGLLSGYPDGRFGPDDQVTRAQLAAVANRILAKLQGK